MALSLLSMSIDLSFQLLCQLENRGNLEKKFENLVIATGWTSVAIVMRGDQTGDSG